MEITNGGRLRVQAMSLLIDTLSKSTLLGAVEFGSALGEQPGAGTLFRRSRSVPNATAMRTALDQKVHADNGATDYNAGFAQSDADNPNANARLGRRPGAADDRRRHRRQVLPAGRLGAAAVGDEQHRRSPYLPRASCAWRSRQRRLAPVSRR
jgi:hypothetical protein